MPGLDGLRGAAVAAVLAYHLSVTSDLDWVTRFARGGAFGVSAFFALSGYLICSLLILEFESNGYISLPRFWSRRFRRLMPAAIVCIVVVMAFTTLVGSGSQLRELPGQAIAALGYVFNWFQIQAGNDYAANFTQPSPLNHFWSLAVEEQAYVVLPFVVAIAMRFGGRRGVTIVCSLIAVTSLGAVLLLGGGQYSNRVYLGTDTRVGEIAIGGLLAALAAGGTGRRLDAAKRWLGPASVAATIAIAAMWIAVPITASWVYRGGLSVHAALVTVVIAALISGTYPLAAALQARPLVWLGKVSYGVYLAHWPIMLWLSASRLGVSEPVAALLQIALTLLVATLSFYALERPIRNGSLIQGTQRVWVPALAVVCVVAGALALPEPDGAQIVALESRGEAIIASTTTPVSSPDGDTNSVPVSGDPVGVAAPSTTPTTAPPPPIRVLITGDSFGLSLGVGFERLAESGAAVSAYNRGLVGCGFGRGGKNRGIGKVDVWPDYCVTRYDMMREDVATFSPDIILVSGGLWDITDRKLAGTNTWTHVGEAAYDAYLIEELRFATDQFAQYGATVVWTTIPTFDPVYFPENLMGKPPYKEAEPGRAERFNELLREALAARPEAHLIDLGAWMKAYPGGEYAPALRTDGVHFTEQSAPEAAQWLLPQLEALRPAR